MFRRFALSAASLLLLPVSAFAVQEVCVSDTNDLAAAFVLAQNQALTIKLKQGSYRLDQTLAAGAAGFVPRDGSAILGGYTGTDCAQRAVATGNTTLTDAAGSGEYGFRPRGDFSIEGLAFNLHRRVTVTADSGSGDTTVAIRRSTFRGSSANNLLAVLWNGSATSVGTLRVIDTVVQGSIPAGYCSVATVDQVGKLKAYFINDTLVNSNCGLGAYDSTAAELADYFVYNSILYGNTATDLQVQTGNITLVDNIIGNRQSPTPAITPIGTITAAPQLDATFHPIVPGSPAIDSGTEVVPGGLPGSDLDGNDRVIGAGVDRGAYESNFIDATVQTVTNTNDSGAGSLRQAILNANGHSGANTINFAIPGNCPRVISVSTNLDALTGSTRIDGFSQTGSSRNTLGDFAGDNATLCVILESGNSAATSGLRVAQGANANAVATIQGIAFSGFSANAVGFFGGVGHRVAGTHFGGVVGGHTLLANGVNILIGGSVDAVQIGGQDPGQRNLIGGATGAGISIGASTTNTQVEGNLIGVGYGSDYVDRGNGGAGVAIFGAGAYVDLNIISANAAQGVLISGASAINASILSNFIGGTYDQTNTSFGNGQAGVLVQGSPGTSRIYYNNVGFNGGPGVHVSTGQHHALRRNAFHDNAGLGIDLDALGVLPNSPDTTGGSIDFANRGQNFPVITQAIGGHSSATVTATLSTTPGDYAIDLVKIDHCDGGGNGEGEFVQDSFTVTVPVPASGTNNTVSFSRQLSGYHGSDNLIGQFLTMTATDANGNTSEFSACKAFVDDTLFQNSFEP